MRPFAILSLVALAALVPVRSARADAPVQLAFFSPAQIVPVDEPVGGLRLDLLYGKNTGMTGVDFGLVNHTTGSELAWQAGLVNLVEEDFVGYQQGGANLTRGDFTGVQNGLYNETQAMTGVAFGWVNRSRRMSGLQIGLVNYTEAMHGLQIGVANIIREGKVPFLPIVNWSF